LLERAPWDSVADDFAARIPYDAPTLHADHLRTAVLKGEADAWLLRLDGARIGLAITRVDEDRGKEFVIQAMYAGGDGQPMTEPVGRQLMLYARSQGCTSMRIHTVRHELARLLTECHGFRLCEVILRKNID
jgi:hypothetical protein